MVFHSLRHSSITYKLKLTRGDIKSVQGDSGHAQAKMVTDQYSHIIDENRKDNAKLFENAFYQGYQYTNRSFHRMLTEAGMTQSMSRVAKCIDNGPMEGFWGILKRERYYGKRFTDRASLIAMVEDFIQYYNTERLQRNLGVLTPMEKYELYFAA